MGNHKCEMKALNCENQLRDFVLQCVGTFSIGLPSNIAMNRLPKLIPVSYFDPV